MLSLSKIGDLSCITSCLVLPGFLMDTLLSNTEHLEVNRNKLLLRKSIFCQFSTLNLQEIRVSFFDHITKL